MAVNIHRRWPMWGILVTFFLPVAVGLTLEHPPAIWSNGISYLGTQPISVPWAGLSECGTAIYLIIASRRWPQHEDLRRSRHFVIALAITLVGLTATPYTVNAVFNWTHMAIGVLNALVQFALLIELVRRGYLLRPLWPLVAFVGGVVSFVSLPDWGIHSMLVGELMMEFAVAMALAVADVRI